MNPDSPYNNAQGVLLRNDLLHNSQAVKQLGMLFISANDKTKANVGNHRFAQTVVSRNQRILTRAFSLAILVVHV
jgi:hypothetical protein